MNRHTIRVLEFEKIRSRLREHCLTAEADVDLRNERISSDRDTVRQHIETAKAVRLCLESTTEFPTLSFPALRDILAVLEKEGSLLDAPDIGAVGAYSRSSVALRQYLERAGKMTDSAQIGELVESVPDLSPVADRIFRLVDPDGTVRERDIPVLRKIRSQINRAQQELQREAQALLGRDDMRRYWNASVPTQRGGRTVLAMKADHRGKVTGIVHEVSSTGATIFIEPDVLVQRNNGVTEATNQYQIELQRLLRELSAFCRENHAVLIDCVEAITRIDKVYARARYAIENDCIAAEMAVDRIMLRSARHPLLGGGAVPITVEFPQGKRLLVVTGPNTGGKTVSLKTVGLLAMMNQFGMEIPAAPGTELPVFTGIYADVGDEQSIEQSLSTFSGHMRNIGRILNGADEQSLVLLDELGSGTDPEEGGALAMAILDELLARGPFTVVTTHHGALKHYGFSQAAAANASVEFDTKSLRPTYRIVPGVPGSSHAIEVAAHMGILRKVTAAAKSYLKGEEYDTGRIIRSLTDREQELHREREGIRGEHAAIENERREMEEARGRLGEKERELREGRLRDLEAWSARTRSELENLVREVREGELTRAKTLRVKEFIAETADDLSRQREAVVRKPTARVAPGSDLRPLSLAPGTTVKVISTGKSGVVIRQSKGSRWQVQIGALRLDVDEDDLAVSSEQPVLKPVVSVSHPGSRPSLEIDLRGKRLEEAMDEVERQIDQAILSGMQSFGIIHGTGEGVLQKGVQDLLRRHAHVRKFAFARPEDGGFGKTVVELR